MRVRTLSSSLPGPQDLPQCVALIECPSLCAGWLTGSHMDELAEHLMYAELCVRDSEVTRPMPASRELPVCLGRQTQAYVIHQPVG